jgi:hypothetical protein
MAVDEEGGIQLPRCDSKRGTSRRVSIRADAGILGASQKGAECAPTSCFASAKSEKV